MSINCTPNWAASTTEIYSIIAQGPEVWDQVASRAKLPLKVLGKHPSSSRSWWPQVFLVTAYFQSLLPSSHGHFPLCVYVSRSKFPSSCKDCSRIGFQTHPNLVTHPFHLSNLMRLMGKNCEQHWVSSSATPLSYLASMLSLTDVVVSLK